MASFEYRRTNQGCQKNVKAGGWMGVYLAEVDFGCWAVQRGAAATGRRFDLGAGYHRRLRHISAISRLLFEACCQYGCSRQLIERNGPTQAGYDLSTNDPWTPFLRSKQSLFGTLWCDVTCGQRTPTLTDVDRSFTDVLVVPRV